MLKKKVVGKIFSIKNRKHLKYRISGGNFTEKNVFHTLSLSFQKFLSLVFLNSFIFQAFSESFRQKIVVIQMRVFY